MKILNFKKGKNEEVKTSEVKTDNSDAIFKAQTPPPTNIQVNAVVSNKVSWPLKIALFLLIIAIAAVTGVIAYIKLKKTPVEVIETIRQVETTEKSKSEIEAEQLNDIAKSPKDISLLTSELTLDKDSIPVKYSMEGYKTINLRILELQNDGKVNIITDKKINDLLSLAQKNNVQIIPVLYINYDAKAENRARLEKLNYDILLNNLNTVITTNNFAGINLDHTLMTDRAVFENLLKDISAKLKKDNKVTKITMAAKWGKELAYMPYLNYSPYYYFDINLKDYDQYIDEVVIEAFNYTTPFSSLSGPISGIQWVEKVIQFTLSQNISKDKLVIGINANGYDWVNREFETDNNSNFTTIEQQASILNSEKMDALLAIVSTLPEAKTDEDSVLNYKLENIQHTLVYPSNGFKQKLKSLAAEYGVKGVSYNGF